jgi:hypothetical protein
MPVFHQMLDRLNDAGVQIAWVRKLAVPGVFVAAYSILILCADDCAADLTTACADVLAHVSQQASP